MPETNQRLGRQPQSSLATKIILFVFMSTFVTAVAVSWTSIQSAHSQLRRFVDRHYPLSVERGAKGMRQWLEGGRAELEALAGGRSLPRSLPDSRHFDGMAWLAADGSPVRVLGSARDLDLEDLPREPALFQRTADVTRVLGIAPRKRVEGFVVGVYRRDRLLEVLEESVPEPRAALFLVDGEGRILAAAPDGAVLRRIPRAEDEHTGVLEYRTARGQHVIGASRPLGIGDWTLAFEAPFELAFEPVLSVVTRVFVIDLCIVLVFSFLAYRITAAIVRPIETLSAGARRIAQGDFDHEIPEPSRRDEIGLLTQTFNDMMRRLRRYQTELEEEKGALLSRNEILSQLSITDGLTHLHNHRFFQDHLTREIKRVMRTKEPLAMLLIDIDDFKALNDRQGHAAGDELLAGMARILSNCVRESDLLARYGGEEFVVLAANTDREGAYLLAEKIRTNIAESSFILDDSLRPTRITVSVGLAQFDGNRKKFFEAADRALYRAKAEGKNCVIVDEPDSADSTRAGPSPRREPETPARRPPDAATEPLVIAEAPPSEAAPEAEADAAPGDAAPGEPPPDPPPS